MTKFYVTSGQLRVVTVAYDPLDAIQKAMKQSNGLTLDRSWFYLDERGHRTHNAKFKVPLERALVEAGYIHDDEYEEDLPPIDWSALTGE